MGFYASVVRPLAFRVDPETVHEWATAALRAGLISAPEFQHPILRQQLFGVEFSNPLGLGAGFDKNAVALDSWASLGFGFVEVGTVTYLPQPGNPRPRLFRLPEDHALINRMGFNNHGALAVAEELDGCTPAIPFGVNIGKSKLADLERSVEDYEGSFGLLKSYGAYAVVNVSSPNTPGLRSLQEKGPLRAILVALRAMAPDKPLFVKVAPDLELTALDDVLEVCLETNCTGIIATNTTLSRDGLRSNVNESGGLSGMPVREKSDAVLAHVAKRSEGRLLLMGVGGIFTADDLYRKISLGAHLCQLYTGWIYGGPFLVPRLLREFAGRLEREGLRSLEELRGSAL